MSWRKKACKALDHSKGLSREALFVLLACEGKGKSDGKRIFDPNSLANRPALTEQLPHRAKSVREGFKELKSHSPRLVNPVGGAAQCTTEGDLVKHAFDGLRGDLVLKGFNHSVVRSFGFVDELVARLREICESPDEDSNE